MLIKVRAVLHNINHCAPACAGTTIHSLLDKNPITRNILKPKFGYNFLGPFNPLDTQIDYDKRLGTIHKIHVKPKNLLDRAVMLYDVCYAIGKNKNVCYREMVKTLIIYQKINVHL